MGIKKDKGILAQNKDSRYRPTYICSVDYQIRYTDNSVENRLPFKQLMLGKLNIYMQKNKFQCILYSIYKN